MTSDPLDAIVAQKHAVRTMRHALEAGRLAHGYLFEGPSGIGKQKTALAVARARLLQGASETQARESQAKVSQGIHPDVRVFAPRSEGSGNLPVEFVRNELRPLVKFAPFEAPACFVLFPNADVAFPAQHPEAANALLKTLEEPRADVHFILMSERPDRLLPTIRSRCQRVRFRRLPDSVVTGILRKHGAGEDSIPAAVALAAGRADFALQLAQSDAETGSRASGLLELALGLDLAVAGGDHTKLLDCAQTLAQYEPKGALLAALGALYRDIAVAGLGFSNEYLAFHQLADRIRGRARELPAREAASRVALIGRVAEELERNANAQLAFEAMLMQMRAASRALTLRELGL